MTTKEEYLKKAKEAFHSQSTILAEYRSKIKEGVIEQKIGAQEQLGRLESKLTVLQTKIVEFGGSTSENSKEVAARIEVLVEDLAISFKKFFGKKDKGDS